MIAVVNKSLDNLSKNVNQVVSVNMPIGAYTDCEVVSTCGISDENGIIGNEDTKQCFYLHFKSTEGADTQCICEVTLAGENKIANVYKKVFDYTYDYTFDYTWEWRCTKATFYAGFKAV